MTLSISDRPSPWCLLSDYPKRHSLLSDATIDPFPSKSTQGASLSEHHIVRDPLEYKTIHEDGRRNALPFLPYRVSPIAHSGPRYSIDARTASLAADKAYEPMSRKRTASIMAEQEETDSSSPASTGQPEGGGQFCLCQPEPKIPRPRNGEKGP